MFNWYKKFSNTYDIDDRRSTLKVAWAIARAPFKTESQALNFFFADIKNSSKYCDCRIWPCTAFGTVLELAAYSKSWTELHCCIKVIFWGPSPSPQGGKQR